MRSLTYWKRQCSGGSVSNVSEVLNFAAHAFKLSTGRSFCRALFALLPYEETQRYLRLWDQSFSLRMQPTQMQRERRRTSFCTQQLRSQRFDVTEHAVGCSDIILDWNALRLDDGRVGHHIASCAINATLLKAFTSLRRNLPRLFRVRRTQGRN